MKKRVRVYQKGGFNGFSAPAMPPLRIAQEGANVQQPQYTDEQLVSVVMSIVGEQGGSPEDAMQQLVSAGVDQNKANQVVSSAIEYINQQRGQGQQAQQQQGQSEEEIAQAQAEADAQAQQQEEADRQSRYNAQMANDQADLDDSEAEIDAFAAEHILRNGGALPSKRSFVKNVMKLTKKAAGGAADDTDIPDGRKAGLQAFVGNLKGKANGYLQEQDAKAMYDMMAPLANESDMYGEDPQMQFGGMRPGQQRRMERRANRMAGRMPAAFFNAQQQMFPQGINIVGMPGMMPGMAAMGPQAFQLPTRGLYAGGPQLANIQVHKTGLFGRPKAWTATFNNSAPYNPDQWMRDMARMNQANKQTEYLDADFDKKEEETNTATAENAEVKNEEAKVEAKTTEGTETTGGTENTGGGGNGATENTGKDERPGVDAPDTNEDVEAEVDENTKKATYENPGIDYSRYFPGAEPITRETLDSRFTNRIPGNVDPRTLSPEYNQELADQGYYNNGDLASMIGKGVTIPNKGTEVKPKLSDLGSTKMIPGMKSVQKSEPVKLNLTNGETVFQLKSGDTKSHFVNKNGKIYKTSKLGDNSQWYEIKDPERVQNIMKLSGLSEKAFNISKPKTTTQPKPGISDLGKTISQPAKQSKPINFVAANQKVGEDEDFRNTVLQSPGKDDDSAYTWKNGKLYETPDFTEQAGFEDWYEVTDPKKIASVTKRMKSEDINVPGDRNYTALQNLERNYRKDPTIGKDLRIPSEERFASSTIDPKYRNLAMRNGKLYIDITMDDDWVEVTDPTFKKNILADRAGQITSGQTITERLPNFDQFFADGGFTDSSNPNLYRFVYGGDDISVPTLNERNTADPYFAYGGYFQTGGGMVAINDASGNRKYVTQNEADAWNSAIKDNADLSLNDMSWASESPRQNPNYRTWDDLKDKGVNVGDFREGIDYTQLEKFPKTTNSNTSSTSYNNYPMYNPAIGAMYPPLFGGGRRFSPAGRMFEYAGSWAKQKGMPFDPRTGQMLGQMPTDLPLTKLDVTKSSMFGKRPKEYTMYFGNYGQLGDNLPKGTPGAPGANAANAPEGQVNDRRNKFAERLMRTPGLRKLGAKLYEQPNLPLPEGTQYTQEKMPSLPLRDTENKLASDLVADRYNKADQPTMDLTGLKDAPIPEVTPEQFSFADQQRFGNVQGPLNQEEATGMGSLPMRPLSTIPSQNSDLVPNSFNYSPQGLVNPNAAAELQRFIPQQNGPMVESDYVDQLGFPRNEPMVDIEGNRINTSETGYPYNVEGPMSNFMNQDAAENYGYELAGDNIFSQAEPQSESHSYYQDQMQPNREVYPASYMGEGVAANAWPPDVNDPSQMYDDEIFQQGTAPEPWLTQDMLNNQRAAVQAEQQGRPNLSNDAVRAVNKVTERGNRRLREREARQRTQNQNRQSDGTSYENEDYYASDDSGANQEYAGGDEGNGEISWQQEQQDRKRAMLNREANLMRQDFRKRYGTTEPTMKFYTEWLDTLEKDPNNKAAQEEVARTEQQYPGIRDLVGTYKNEMAQRAASEKEAQRIRERQDKVETQQYWLNQFNEWRPRLTGQYAYGGMIPRGQTGLFTTNPDLVGFSDIDLINAQTAPEVSGSVNNATGNWWSASPNMPTIQETGMAQPEQMTIDPNQQYTHQMKREYDPRGAAVKFKVKNMYNVDFERGINVGNALINRGLAVAGELGDRNRRAQMANNLTADNLYGNTNSRDRGTYETNSGLFRPDEKGFKGVVKHGGAIYKTGGVTYMSADQVKRFLAEGGELEFV